LFCIKNKLVKYNKKVKIALNFEIEFQIVTQSIKKLSSINKKKILYRVLRQTLSKEGFAESLASWHSAKNLPLPSAKRKALGKGDGGRRR